MKSLILAWTVAVAYVGQSHAQYLSVRGSVPLTPRSDVASAGSNAYAVGANSFTVVSFASPQSPEVIGQVAPGVGNLSAVALRGSYAYCAGQTSGIVVIDVSNPDSPDWVRNVQAAAPVADVSVGDTFLVAATNLNVAFYGLSNPSQPRLLTTFGRAANQVLIEAAARKIHCAGSDGAFVLSWTINQGNVLLSEFDEFGSSGYACVGLGDTYVNFAQGLQFSALNKNTYTLAGQYGAASQITTISSGTAFSVFGTATGSVEYLRQSAGTPQFASSVQTGGGVNGLAVSGDGLFVLAATAAGVTVIANSPLGSNPVPPMPDEFQLTAFPNPFNGATTLSWTTPLKVPLSVRVFDVLGREVLVRPIPANASAIALDFAPYAGGNYWLMLDANLHTAPIRVTYVP